MLGGRDSIEDVVPGAASLPQPVEVVFERDTHDVKAPPPGGAHMHTALEIWTLNRVYVVDSAFVCTRVVDRRTGQFDNAHSTLGATLAGGQRRYGKTLHMARPFPVPGTEAMFTRMSGDKNPTALTSKVERVVLRIRVTTLVFDDDGAFDDVTSHLLQPGPGQRRMT